MRNAFTMIELVFIIVILGILSAVAIPKLLATRDDARVSRIAINIMTGVSEIASYAVSHEHIENNLSKMSNAITSLISTGDAVLGGDEINISLGGLNCMTLEVDSNSTSGEDVLNIYFNTNNNSLLCSALKGAINETQYPIKLRGPSVSY